MTNKNGYYLAMNRDEQISRQPALQPALHQFENGLALYPSEEQGGTWIATTSFGLTFALLNWYDVTGATGQKLRSRGELIPKLMACRSQLSADLRFAGLDLAGILPFRLVGIFPAEEAVCEWRWDGRTRSTHMHPWEHLHWFSSSLSDSEAQQQRGSACQQALREPDAGSLGWLRRLHASHAPGPGPFSICVHRASVKTLSFTEICCTPEFVRMAYFGASPCEMQTPNSVLELPRSAVTSTIAANPFRSRALLH